MQRHPPRQDRPGAWHHVMNRAVGRRPFFEDRFDLRYFLAWLARQVREGRLKLHAFSLLNSHFHLLLESCWGELSLAMRDIEKPYVYEFNRRRERDGPLVRGRFRSKLVDSSRYRRILLRYIDYNAVEARLAVTPWSYEFGSARYFVTHGGPPWLERSWVESLVGVPYDPSRYESVVGRRLTPALVRFVEARLRRTVNGPDDLDQILEGPPSRLPEWLRERARVADGMPVGLALVDAASVDAVVRAAARRAKYAIYPHERRRCGWTVLHVALLRELAKLSGAETARRLRLTPSSVARAYEAHAAQMGTDPEYVARAAALAEQAVRRCHDEG